MKKIIIGIVAVFVVIAVTVTLICVFGTKSNSENEISSDNTLERKITKEMAYEGVNNYCHSEYDWSAAEDNPSIMYVEMGEESETEYKVIFRSYTGSFVYFFVSKSDGTTSMVEYNPTLDEENKVGMFDLYDFLNEQV